MQQLSDWFHITDLMREELYYCFISSDFGHMTKDHKNSFDINRNLEILFSYSFVNPVFDKLHDGSHKGF